MASRVGRGIAVPFLDRGIRRGEWSAVRPNRTLPPGKTWYPLYRRLGGPQGQSGQARKISPPTWIRSPDRPARSQSLYLLSYPVHILIISKKWKLEELDFLDLIQGVLCLTVTLFGTDCPNCAVLMHLTCNFLN
jgi:hypothetical protein